MHLRPYQHETIQHLLHSPHQREVVCMPTGAGKTVVFTQFCTLSGLRVLILVNRSELLNQTAKTMQGNCVLISPEKRYKSLPISRTYIAMVETLARRKQLLQDLRERVDVLIVDECHIGNFNKLLDGFKRVIGFSATPKSSKKRESLQDHYHNLYVSTDVEDLIADGYLIDAVTYAPDTNFEFKLNKTGTDYDESDMGETLSAPVYVKNLEKYLAPERTIIYNSSINHSEIVTQHLQSAGYKAKHIDGGTPKAERQEIVKWLFDTPDAILCNVGVLTFGFDCPDVKRIILNRRTLSVQLYLQMCGRGSRLPLTVQKPEFTIIDMVGNYELHGLWQDRRDWHKLFASKTVKPPQAAPYKSCIKCESIIPVSAKICKFCNTEQPIKEKVIDPREAELVRIERIRSRVEDVVADVLAKDQSPYRALHIIKSKIYKKNEGASVERLNELILQVLPHWCKLTKKRHNQFNKDYAIKIMTEYYESKHIPQHQAN